MCFSHAQRQNKSLENYPPTLACDRALEHSKQVLQCSFKGKLWDLTWAPSSHLFGAEYLLVPKMTEIGPVLN